MSGQFITEMVTQSRQVSFKPCKIALRAASSVLNRERNEHNEFQYRLSPGKKKNRTKFCRQEKTGKVEENMLGQKHKEATFQSLETDALAVFFFFIVVAASVSFVLYCFVLFS